jgi:hypothetical protein
VELVLVDRLGELNVKEIVCLAVSQGDSILSFGGKIGVFLENSQHFWLYGVLYVISKLINKYIFFTFKFNFFKKRRKLQGLRGFPFASRGLRGLPLV